MMPKSDAAWEAESDANTLADATAIRADKPRMKKAATAAKRLAKEKQDQATGMKRVASQAPRKKKASGGRRKTTRSRKSRK